MKFEGTRLFEFFVATTFRKQRAFLYFNLFINTRANISVRSLKALFESILKIGICPVRILGALSVRKSTLHLLCQD